MPWKERSVMEERMRFVLRLKDGRAWLRCAASSGSPGLPDTKSMNATKSAGLPYMFVPDLIIGSRHIFRIGLPVGQFHSCSRVAESKPKFLTDLLILGILR